MVSKKTFWVTIVVLILFLILLPGGTWYFMQYQKNQQLISKNDKISELKEQLEDLKDQVKELEKDLGAEEKKAQATNEYEIYTNTTLGFSFKYPKDYEIEEDNLIESKDESAVSSQYLELKNNNFSFGMWINPDGFGLGYAEYSYEIILSSENKLVLGTQTINSEPETEDTHGYDPDNIHILASNPEAISGLKFIIWFRYPETEGDKTAEFEKFFSDFKLI